MATTDGIDSANTADTSESLAANVSRRRLAQDKLAAFQSLEVEFVACFRYMGVVQGQQRLPEFPVAQSVRFLHALWICECKDNLLSVPLTQGRYEGRRCLELLRIWQEGDTASVVAFLQRKLDNLSCADLTAQIREARVRGDPAWAERLEHGRNVMLNRGFHLLQALDAIFAPSDYLLNHEVRRACRQLGHTPRRIERQLAEMETRLYSYAPHPLLARRNMLVMNELGISVTNALVDLPGNRTDRVQAPTLPNPPYAEQTVVGEMTLI
ncbi:MAG: hypothetical protein ACLQUY_00890 [Ktedonobacterales bacterium]